MIYEGVVNETEKADFVSGANCSAYFRVQAKIKGTLTRQETKIDLYLSISRNIPYSFTLPIGLYCHSEECRQKVLQVAV